MWKSTSIFSKVNDWMIKLQIKENVLMESSNELIIHTVCWLLPCNVQQAMPISETVTSANKTFTKEI